MYKLFIREINNVWYTVVLGDDDRIATCSFSCIGRKNAIANILSSLPKDASFTEVESGEMTMEVIQNMHRIYEGKIMEHEFKLDMDRIPQFTKKVLLITYMIPHGFVTTYGGIAEALGKKGAARAVGNAEATNPYAPIVPCHRVVGSDRGLGGYGGGLDIKRELLIREGVTFEGNRVSTRNLWMPNSVY